MKNLSERTEGNNANTLLGAVFVYFVEYDWAGYKRHCQIEARSETEARDIFQRRFDYCCRITKIQTTEDIANEVSDELIGVIKIQLKFRSGVLLK